MSTPSRGRTLRRLSSVTALIGLPAFGLGAGLLRAQDPPEASLELLDEGVRAQWSTGAGVQMEMIWQGLRARRGQVTLPVRDLLQQRPHPDQLVVFTAQMGARWTKARVQATYRVLSTPEPDTNTQDILTLLERSGLLLRTADEEPAYVPARTLEAIPVIELLAAARSFEEGLGGYREAPDSRIQGIEKTMETALAQALDGITLKDLATAPSRSETARHERGSSP